MNHVENVVLPHEVPMGYVIGRSGIHINRIKRDSRARLHIENGTRTVTISGAQPDVQRAIELLENHLEAYATNATPFAQAHSERLAIPEGVPVGHIIGKAGSNLKSIQNETGARLQVDSDGRGCVPSSVVIAGSELAMKRAGDMLRAQFAAHEEGKALPYAHTRHSGFVLGESLSMCEKISFVERERKTSTCMRFDDPGFEIIPARSKVAAETATDEYPWESELTSQMKFLPSITPKKRPITEMRVWSELPLSVDVYAALLSGGIGDHSGVLKFNFGKQTFYGPSIPPPGTSIDLAEFCDTFHVHRHKGYRTCYVNWISQKEAEGLGAILSGSFGFEKNASLTNIVEHMIDQRNNVGHEVHFGLPSGLDGPLELQACEAAGTTVGFLPIVCGGRERNLLDVRFKIKGFTSSDSHQENPGVLEFAKGAQFVDGKLVFESNKYVNEATRVKNVTPYTGKVGGRDLTVNMIHVSLTEKEETSSHWEVTGVLDIPPLLNTNELMELVTFALAVAEKLPAQLESSTK